MLPWRPDVTLRVQEAEACIDRTCGRTSGKRWGQCDLMLKWKLTQFFIKCCPKSSHSGFYFKSNIIISYFIKCSLKVIYWAAWPDVGITNSLIFSKEAELWPHQFPIKKWGFSKEPKSCKIFGLLLNEKLLPRPIKINPTWSHCVWVHLYLTFLEGQARPLLLVGQEQQQAGVPAREWTRLLVLPQQPRLGCRP